MLEFKQEGVSVYKEFDSHRVLGGCFFEYDSNSHGVIGNFGLVEKVVNEHFKSLDGLYPILCFNFNKNIGKYVTACVSITEQENADITIPPLCFKKEEEDNE